MPVGALVGHTRVRDYVESAISNKRSVDRSDTGGRQTASAVGGAEGVRGGGSACATGRM